MPLYSFLGIFLVLLSLFQGCSREDKEEHAGSDISLPPESFRIVSVEPEDAAEQVSIQTSLKVVFNSEIDQETVYPGSILLLQNSTFIQGNHEVNGKSLIFQPQDNLSHSTTYQWSVVSGIRNLNGQMLETTTRMTFKTEDYVDRIQPRLLLVTPQDNASGVAIDSSIELTFSEPILSESLNAENFSLLDANGQSVPGVFNTSGSDAVFTPSAALDHFREYRIQIGTGITDLSGNFLDGSSETSFETLGNVVISPADPEGMILISGGRFMMGADSQTDSDAEANEGPVHSVTLKGPFYISDHEVTVGEYKACVDAGGCTQPGSGTYSDNLSLPVNKVSWVQANEFAQWKTSQASKTYRLCTSAEWEYAARAGTTTPWSFPEDANPQDYAWYDSNNKVPYGTGPKRVKTKLPNAFGLYDVHGNLREWVQDFSSDDYSADANGVTDPKGPLQGDDRVTRGGHYSESRKYMRSSHREPKTETSKYVGVGIRLCADP